jgi:uncharacterized protein (TIGR02266 family)
MGNHAERKFERFKGSLPCSFLDAGSTHRGFVTNLSEGGLYLQTEAEVEAGTKLVIDVEFEPGNPFVLTGTVVQTQPSQEAGTATEQSGMGFKLESAPDAYLELVREMLEVTGSQSG